MKLGGWILLLLFVMLALPLVSSTIIIDDDFDDLYNVGDLVEVNFSILKDYTISGFVEVVLDCDDENFILKKDYVSLEENKKKYIYLESPLAIEGDCRVEISFLNEVERSVEFEVSDDIIIDYTLNDRFFLPYEKLIINGSVEKENGEDYNGILRIEIEDLDEKSVEVIDGNFDFEYDIKIDSVPKEYDLEIIVEERDFNDRIMNSGEQFDRIEIRPKATSIEIEAEEEIVPPSNFSFNVELLDQIDRPFENETIVVKLTNPLGDIVYQEEILGGKNGSYEFEGDAMKGGWLLKAYYSNLLKVKPIYVDANEEIESAIVGNVLYFENVGNVPYEGVIDFILDNGSFEKIVYVNISVDVGETYEHPVYYIGEYNVTINGEYLGEYQLTREPGKSGITGYFIFDNYEFTNASYFFLGGVLVFLFLVWFFVFKKKVFRKMGKSKVSVVGAGDWELGDRKSEGRKLGKEEMNLKTKAQGEEKVQNNKLVVKEKDEDKKTVVRKNYILFLESNVGVSSFESIIEKYGFKLNKVEENLGYVLFFNSKEKNPDLKLYNLSKAIMRFSGVKKAKTSIVINRGLFENKLTLLKKFALLNRKLLNFCEGKILMTKKFFESLDIGVQKETKKVEVMGRNLEVCLV